MVELEYGHLNSLETCSGEDAKRLQECGDLLWERVAELSDKKMISDFIFLMHFVEERKLRGEYARKNAQCIHHYARVLMDRVLTTRPEREALINILRCVRKYPDGRGTRYGLCAFTRSTYGFGGAINCTSCRGSRDLRICASRVFR
jgi:hypothetical protein